ncbi:unnamed protein product, partial [Prunus brigantina]
EIRGLYFGLKLAMTKGITCLNIEMDAAVVVQLVKNIDDLAHHPFAPLINACCALMKHFDICTLLHIYREGNSVANELANWSYNLDLGILYFDEAPGWIGSLLIDDITGVAKARLVCPVSL